ncbi:hypothetical protein, partial [Pseudoalteromonas phenolica]
PVNRALYGSGNMRITLLFLFFVSFTSLAETFVCDPHPEWPNDRKFKAKIEVSEVGDGLEAKLIDINLSEPWPLTKQCDSPLMIANKKMKGWPQGRVAKFWLPNDKECSFMIYLTLGGDEPAMLSPRRTNKSFGEKPYLARCTPI